MRGRMELRGVPAVGRQEHICGRDSEEVRALISHFLATSNDPVGTASQRSPEHELRVPVRSPCVGADGVEDERMPTSNHGRDQVFHRVAPM